MSTPLLRPGAATRLLALAIAAAGAACDPPPARLDDTYEWRLPAGFAPPPVPADNPMSAVKVELGRQLFYDRRLSRNQRRSCGICHEQKRGFTDGFVRSVGTTDQIHPRNSQPLANVAYRPTLTWASPEQRALETQLLVPLLGTAPVELGMAGMEALLLGRLRAAPYAGLFAEAFPGVPEPVSLQHVAQAIACFERTLVSGNAPFDRHRRGDELALSPAARRGMALFFGPRLRCSRCHGGPDLASPSDDTGAVVADTGYFNTGLYDVDGRGGYPAGGEGLLAETGEPADMGRFRVPSLRNVAVTGPYMHDGSMASLEQVLAHYAAGGRVTTSGPNVGDGRRNPYKDPLVSGFALSSGERDDLVAFLESLTDGEFLAEPAFADPQTGP